MQLSQDAILVRETASGSGLTVAVKDCLDMAGEVTGCGSRALSDNPPAAKDAEIVKLLRAAGCTIVGRANMHELAYGMTGINGFTGTPVNPRFPSRIVGGSSSGSAAAVAAEMVAFSIGTDTGGSIRLPATCCGVVGLKPTFGRVSRAGAVPADSTLDCIGPLAPDMATLIDAMAIICPGFTPESALANLMIGRVMCEVDSEIGLAFDRAMEQVAAPITRVELPLLAEAHRAGLTLMGAEMAQAFGHLTGSGLLGADVDARLAAACAITADQVAAAEQVRMDFTKQVDALLDRFTVLALPTLPSVPLLAADAGDAAAALRLSSLVRPFNLSGHPALTLPITTADGLPAGVQLVGRRDADATLCAAGLTVEAIFA